MIIDYKKYPTPRMRHHTGPNLYVPFNEFKVLPRFYPPLLPEIDWNQYFTNGKAPCVLDIGCGRGGFLLEYALNHPAVNIFGVEVRKQAVEWIHSIIKGENLLNAAVEWYNTTNGLPFISSESLDAVYYFFPDPWHKKKHHKRRAFNDYLVNEIHRVLKPEGKLYLMTDVIEVDMYQRSILDTHKGFEFKYAQDEDWNLPRTDHENFSIKKNIPYIRAIVSKSFDSINK
ncbi:MAG: tRNA (guanosine(46)-N7)-methyltransferase TrmB [Ignavibacteria bacterium]|nr:tRNA (guanosine(46)-N7)-methyltransferase TrmB [Ignavibacteria bacterium]